MELYMPAQGAGGLKQPQPPPSRPPPSSAGRLAPPRVISWDALEPTEDVKGAGSFGTVSIYRWGERVMRVAVKEMKGDMSGLLSTHDIDSLKAEATLQVSKHAHVDDPGSSHNHSTYPHTQHTLACLRIASSLVLFLPPSSPISSQSALEHDGVVRVYGIAEGGVSGGAGKARNQQRLGLVMRAYEGPLDVSVLAAVTTAQRFSYVQQVRDCCCCVALVWPAAHVLRHTLRPLLSADRCWCGVSACRERCARRPEGTFDDGAEDRALPHH